MRVWIHGAFSTKNSFNFFKTQMDIDSDLYIQYDTNADLVQTLQKIKKKIEKHCDEDDQVDLVGHSLGGVFCVLLYHMGLKVRSIATMSAPFGGITNHPLLRFWFPKSIYTEFHKLELQYSHLIKNPIEVPYLFIVSTNGSNPLFLTKKNDGVVAVDSQKAIVGVKYDEISVNHYEILMSEIAVKKLKSFHEKL
jgi:triacylglycerol esterase/lipase EstA (alpha/beta hydrolase family)